MKVIDKAQCSALSVVLVTEATGFVGAKTVLNLAQHGHEENSLRAACPGGAP